MYERVRLAMTKFLGIFRELPEEEELVFTPKSSVPTLFAREMEIRKLMGVERKEQPLIYAVAYPYLTDKRLIILALHQVESKTLTERKAPRMAARSGAWLDIPLSSISVAELRSIEVKKDRDLSGFLDWSGFREALVERSPAIEVIYDEKQASGKVKDYIDLVAEMGLIVKDPRKVERSYDKVFLIGEMMVEDFLPLLKEQLEKTLEIRESSESEEALA